jgi:hypothetical protein
VLIRQADGNIFNYSDVIARAMTVESRQRTFNVVIASASEAIQGNK